MTNIHLRVSPTFSVMVLIVLNAPHDIFTYYLNSYNTYRISKTLPGYSLHSGADMGAMLAVLESYNDKVMYCTCMYHLILDMYMKSTRQY